MERNAVRYVQATVSCRVGLKKMHSVVSAGLFFYCPTHTHTHTHTGLIPFINSSPWRVVALWTWHGMAWHGMSLP